MAESEQQWAGSDFQEPPRTEGGVALCGACRSEQRCHLGLTTERLDAHGVARFAVVCPDTYEGGPGVAHGGWTAGLLDEVLGHVPILHGQMSVTAELTVSFVKPVPINRPLQAWAAVDHRQGSRWYISGELVLAATGALLARATGIWVARDRTHFDRFQSWLQAQDDSER
jgi:uncharacterized protein (TIGR00369 family)